MTDPVRARVLAVWGVDDPLTAVELPAPRARFALAAGPDAAPAVDEAIRRALALADALPRPMSLRLIAWDDAPVPLGEWFPGVGEDLDAADGRCVYTLPLGADLSGLAAALSAAWRDGADLDVWLLAPGDLLLRPYDDRGADLVAPTVAALAPFVAAFASWLLTAPREP
jgi:hypothetical protein